jgi:hypothetical protein
MFTHCLLESRSLAIRGEYRLKVSEKLVLRRISKPRDL